MTDIREQARQALDGDLVEPMALSCETIAEVEEMHARGIASMTDCTCNENGHLSTIHDLAIEEVPALLRTLRSRDALIAGLLAELERVTAFSLYQQVCRTLQAAPTEAVEVAARRVVAERDAALSTLHQVREEHQPEEDWVPVHNAPGGKELRGVYCSCGNLDYNECATASMLDGGLS